MPLGWHWTRSDLADKNEARNRREDCNFESIVPFCGMRALSLDTDPDTASCSFDTSRNGFVGTGGAVCMVLEAESEAKRRNATSYAKFIGWGPRI